MQDFRDLLGRLPLTHELQYLPLARRQLGAILAGGRGAGVDDCLRGAGTDVQPAIAHLLYSVHEFVAPLALLDEPPHPDLQRLFHKALVVDAGQEDDGTGRRHAGDFTGRIDAIQHRHGDVQHRNVGGEPLHRGDGGPAIGLIGHDLQPLSLQQGFQRLPQHKTHHITTVGTERHTNADLANALAYSVRHDAMHSDRCKQQCQCP